MLLHLLLCLQLLRLLLLHALRLCLLLVLPLCMAAACCVLSLLLHAACCCCKLSCLLDRKTDRSPELAKFSGALTWDVNPIWCRFSSARISLPCLS